MQRAARLNRSMINQPENPPHDTPSGTPPETPHNPSDPAPHRSEVSDDSFVRLATVDDFPEDDDCLLCAMERERVRNGAVVEIHSLDLADYDEDDEFEF
jgi:hypothetical protein